MAKETTLILPSPTSCKGDNGSLFIIGGCEKIHGAPILAAKAAARIVDLVFFTSLPRNNDLIQSMRSHLLEFITASEKEMNNIVQRSDVILIGPGMGVNNDTEKTVNNLLEKYNDKDFVLDADALKVVDVNLLGPNVIVTPHSTEFEIMFGIDASRENAIEMSKKHNCIVVLKGPTDYVAFDGKCNENNTGNEGMTAGGTGDVLAGLIAALATTNDLFLSAYTGVYINGFAGDRLYEKVGPYFSATDLIEELPATLNLSRPK